MHKHTFSQQLPQVSVFIYIAQTVVTAYTETSRKKNQLERVHKSVILYMQPGTEYKL